VRSQIEQNAGARLVRAFAPRAGLGLENVRRRMEICYGAASGLRLSLDGETAVAELSIPVVKSVEMTVS